MLKSTGDGWENRIATGIKQSRAETDRDDGILRPFRKGCFHWHDFGSETKRLENQVRVVNSRYGDWAEANDNITQWRRSETWLREDVGGNDSHVLILNIRL